MWTHKTAETYIYIWGLCLGPHAITVGPGQACLLTWVCEAIVRTRKHMAKKAAVTWQNWRVGGHSLTGCQRNRRNVTNWSRTSQLALRSGPDGLLLNFSCAFVRMWNEYTKNYIHTKIHMLYGLICYVHMLYYIYIVYYILYTKNCRDVIDLNKLKWIIIYQLLL